MGNEMCNASQNPEQNSRYKIFSSACIQIEEDRTNLRAITPTKTQLVRQDFNLEENIKEYIIQDKIIKCKQKHAKFINIKNLNKQLSIFNGFVKVYENISKGQQLIYQGQVKNSKFDGFGNLYQNGTLIYQGEFKNHKYQGWGITSNYEGEFRNGKFDGYGIYKQYNQIIGDKKKACSLYYEGYFQNGLRSGSGVQIKGGKWPLSEIEKINNMQRDKGIFNYLNQQIQNDLPITQKYGIKQIYIGQYSNNYRHGFGRLITRQFEFSGQFSHDLYHGLGSIYNKGNNGKKILTISAFEMGKPYKT